MNHSTARKLLVLGATLQILLFAQQAFGQSNPKWPISLAKGATVTLKIPNAAITLEKVSVWTGAYSYTVYVDQDGDNYTVGSHPDWQDLGWPSQLVLSVNKVERKKEYTQVELDDPRGNHIKLRFTPSVKDVSAALLALVHPGTLSDFQSSEYYQKQVADRHLPKIFKGPLAAIPRDFQLKMIDGAGYDLNAVGSETYKGRFFIVFRDTGREIYNSIQLNQTARAARAMEKYIFAAMRGAYKALADIEGLDGVKVELKVGYKDFVSEEYSQPHYDELHIYATKDVLKKFAEDDITSQQFVNDSIVLVNGNRTDVSLNQSK